MMTVGQREKVVSDLLRATYESVEVEDIAVRVLPLLDNLMNTSTSLLFEFNLHGEMIPISGGMSEVVPIYARDYIARDPLQTYLKQTNPVMLHSSQMPIWQEYLSSAAFNECASPNKIDNFIHLRLTDSQMREPGMVAIMLSRTFRQPDFSERDKKLIRTVMPSLRAFGCRYARLNKRLKAQPFVESIFEFSHPPTIILDPHGGLLWASERAEALLHITAGGCTRIPVALETAARKLGTLMSTHLDIACLPTTVSIPLDNKPPLEGTVRLARTRNGAYFIVVELEEPNLSPNLMEVAARYQLTKAETQVLHLISLGLGDQEIGRRLCVSFATVRTHVSRIHAKLAVKSRTQAALIARGHTTAIHSKHSDFS